MANRGDPCGTAEYGGGPCMRVSQICGVVWWRIPEIAR